MSERASSTRGSTPRTIDKRRRVGLIGGACLPDLKHKAGLNGIFEVMLVGREIALVLEVVLVERTWFERHDPVVVLEHLTNPRRIERIVLREATKWQRLLRLLRLLMLLLLLLLVLLLLLLLLLLVVVMLLFSLSEDARVLRSIVVIALQ